MNLNVTGFKIFGEFSGAYVTGTVLSPLAQNVVGIWFNLKSPLRASLETGQTSQMKLWLPPTFQPLFECGTPENLFSLSYDVGRELVKNPFPTTVRALAISFYYPFYMSRAQKWRLRARQLRSPTWPCPRAPTASIPMTKLADSA